MVRVPRGINAEVVVEEACEPLAAGGLRLVVGRRIRVVRDSGDGWYIGRDTTDGEVGIFPSNFVRRADDDGSANGSGRSGSARAGAAMQGRHGLKAHSLNEHRERGHSTERGYSTERGLESTQL